MESWGLRLRKVCVECYGQDQVLVLSCVRFVCSELMGIGCIQCGVPIWCSDYLVCKSVEVSVRKFVLILKRFMLVHVKTSCVRVIMIKFYFPLTNKSEEGIAELYSQFNDILKKLSKMSYNYNERFQH